MVQSIFYPMLRHLIAPTIINKSNNHKIIIITMTTIIIIIIIIIKRAPFLRVYSFTLALHLQLVPLCDNFHAFEEALILQRQTLWSFYQRSTYSIELELWVNQETLRSFYKFSKLKMKTFGDYLGNSFVLAVHVRHKFLYISLRPLQNYNVKSLNQLCVV